MEFNNKFRLCAHADDVEILSFSSIVVFKGQSVALFRVSFLVFNANYFKIY